MGCRLNPLAVALVGALLAFGAGAAHAGHTEPKFIAIKYGLQGVSALSPVLFTTAVYGPSSPAPGNVQQPTGSFVTFSFSPGPATNFFSGSVQMLSMVISQGVTIPNRLTGYQRLELDGPLDGGYLTNPVSRLPPYNHTPPPGRIAGAGIGLGTSNGFVHCIASPAACYAELGIAPGYQSTQLGLGANDPATGGTIYWSANNPGLTGVPIPWAGGGTGGPGSVLGYWSVTEGGLLLGRRPFCTALGDGASTGPCTGTTLLVGSEIARWQNLPEPAFSPLLLLGLAGVGWLSLRFRGLPPCRGPS